MNQSKINKEVTKIRKEFTLEETLGLLHELTWVIMRKNEKPELDLKDAKGEPKNG